MSSTLSATKAQATGKAAMALREEEGGDSPRPERPSPERLLPQEQDALLPE
jgi:hypothetical protein